MLNRLFPLALLWFAVAGLSTADPPSRMAIRGARVYTVSGPVLEKATVLIKDGLIEDVGENVAIPAGVTVIDGSGLNVYPGLIDALSTWGIADLATPATPAGGARGAPAPAAPATTPPQPPQPRVRGPEDRPNAFTWVMAADLVKPTDRRLETARSAGFTTAVTFPRQGILAGHGAVINLAGETGGDMVLDPSAGLYTTLATGGFSGGFPGSLMGVMAYERQLWIDAAYYKAAREAYAQNPVTVARPPYDRALEGLLETRRLLFPANSRVQIERLLRFAAEFKTPFILYGGQEAFRTADLLKKAGVPVVLNVKWPARERDSDPEFIPSLRTLELRDKAPTTPSVLAAAKVPFAISSEGLDAPRDILKALKKSIAVGLKPDDAIRALTLSAAEIYGVAGRLGSIDRGKIANLTLVKGDLFDDKSKVEMVFIDGKRYLPAPEEPPARPAGAAPGGKEQ
ncbi:MAG: amidohydrolase family protein [Bryobacteraceae bacterium]